ncbi:hypothetical protein BJV77DRAFT_1080564 [Russula vinacea]|nr:hypothetical protein BJV77DRAFT_1080564 [Russula vinacea]
MSATPRLRRIGTRASNSEKHPGLPDQKSKRRSVAEMATVRAAEKDLKDKKDAAELTAASDVAGVEDMMAEIDRNDDENAARPISLAANIARAARPLHRSYAFTTLKEDDKDSEDQIDGDAGSEADSVEMYSHGADYIPGADKASPIDEPELELEPELDEGTGPAMKVTKKGKGSARALIASKREPSNAQLGPASKKFKAVASIPSGLIKGFKPRASATAAANLNATASSRTTSGSSNKSVDAVFKMGGLENLDDNGIEIVEKRYARYRDSDCSEAEAGAKGRRGLGHQGLVKINPNEPTERLGESCPIQGTLPNPWKYHNIDVPGNLQSRWDATYPALATRILPKEAIFTHQGYVDITTFQSMQRITEWRGMFGSGAIAALKTIWASLHIVTATVPSRKIPHRREKVPENPKGALLLAIVASERALKQYAKTGELVLSTRKCDNHFSEEIWSDVALHYQVSVEALSQESWDLIIDGAWQIAQDKPAGRASSSRLPGGAQLPEVNERQLLVEDSDPISGDEDDMEWDEVPPLSRQESVEVSTSLWWCNGFGTPSVSSQIAPLAVDGYTNYYITVTATFEEEVENEMRKKPRWQRKRDNLARSAAISKIVVDHQDIAEITTVHCNFE